MTTAPRPADEKSRLRAEVRARRRERDAAALAAVERATSARLRELLTATGGRRMAAFLSTPLEPSTRLFLRWARAYGVEVLLPVPHDDGRLGWALDTGEERLSARWRVPEPAGPELPPGALAGAGPVVIPAALVDRAGGRLGWGGGFYDRALAELDRIPAADRPEVWALVHDDELVDRLPREPHDRPVDGVATPAGLVRFA